jgi:hypothetical protein
VGFQRGTTGEGLQQICGALVEGAKEEHGRIIAHSGAVELRVASQKRRHLKRAGPGERSPHTLVSGP